MASTLTAALIQNAAADDASDVKNSVRKNIKNLSTSICSATVVYRHGNGNNTDSPNMKYTMTVKKQRGMRRRGIRSHMILAMKYADTR